MSKIFELGSDREAGFAAALEVLRSGELVAVPTETVYGLAADARNDDAVARIFEAKGRPSFNPLICHVSGLEMAEKYGVFDEASRRIAEQVWPGPLTLVVPLRTDTGCSDAVTAGLGTIALRHAPGIMGELSGALGGPIAAPSANRSGKISPTLAAHVAKEMGDLVDVILDGGPCSVGVESTIVKVDGDKPLLLRPGAVGTQAFGGSSFLTSTDGKIEAPGMMLSHYAPRLPLRLERLTAGPGDAFLTFGKTSIESAEDAVAVKHLSPAGDLEEAARNLYAMLKQLDESGADAIAVQPIPKEDIGIAINDRLGRAAAPGDDNAR